MRCCGCTDREGIRIQDPGSPSSPRLMEAEVERYFFYAETEAQRFFGVLMAWSKRDAKETIERKIGPTRRIDVHESQVAIFAIQEVIEKRAWSIDYMRYLYDELPEPGDLEEWARLHSETDFSSEEAKRFHRMWRKIHG